MDIKINSTLHVTATEKRHIRKLIESGLTQAKINTKYYCIMKGSQIKNGWEYTIVINTPQRSERTNEIVYNKQSVEVVVKNKDN
jgi:hypothetical protein